MGDNTLNNLLRKLTIVLEIRGTLAKTFEEYDPDSREERYRLASEILNESEHTILEELFQFEHSLEK